MQCQLKANGDGQLRDQVSVQPVYTRDDAKMCTEKMILMGRDLDGQA